MKVTPATPVTSEDTTPIKMTADAEAVFNKFVLDVAGAAAYLMDLKDSGRLSNFTAVPVIRCLAIYVENLGQALDIPSETAAERHQRYAEFRRINDENTTLRARLAAQFPAGAMGEKIAEIDAALSDMWREMGFSLIDLNFRGTYAFVKFSLMLNDRYSMFSATPVTDGVIRKSEIDQMREDGLVLAQNSSQAWDIVSSDSNKAWILARLRTKLPTLKPLSWKELSASRGDELQLWKLKTRIDIGDLLKLAETT